MNTIISRKDKRFKHPDKIFTKSRLPLMDLMGKRFDRLTVKEWLGVWKYQNYWLCECECGNTVEASARCLNSGNTGSCGCKFRKHDKTETPIHNVWLNMRRRCFETSNKSYANYGGRGITVCDRWMSFENFYEDMGDPPPGMTLERIDVNGNYCPENCRWATWKEQANNKRTNVKLSVDGIEKTASQVAEELGISSLLICERLKRGYSQEQAIAPPVVGKLITYNGRTMTMMDWSRELGATKTNIVSKRLRRGWSLEKALTTPLISQ